MSNDLNKKLASATSHEEIDAILHDGPSYSRTPRAADEPTTAANADSLTKRLAEATSHQEIDAILHEGPSQSRTPIQPAEPKTYTRTETILGDPITFEAATEVELEREVAKAYKIAAEHQQPAPVVDYHKAGEDAAIRSIAQLDLELKFKRGEVSTQEYLERSGAVKDYLESQGVPIEDLRATVEENRNKAVEQSWAEATTTFLNLPGNTWPGGEKNKQILGLKLQELGLLDADDKTAAIQQAYDSMKQDGLIFANDGSGPARGPDGRFRAAAPHDASPQELLEQWKAAQPSVEDANKSFTTFFGGH